MNAIALVEALATFAWCYSGLTFLAWVRRAARLERRMHIPAVTDLIGHLVPAMILLVLVVLVGALLGLPSIVVLIALLFPAGLAFGVHMALTDLREAPFSLRTDFWRITGTIGLSLVTILYRQIA